MQQFITQSLPPISSDRITCGSHHQCENNFLPRDHSHEAWYLHLLIIGEEGDRESGGSLPSGGGGGAGIVLLKLQIPRCVNLPPSCDSCANRFGKGVGWSGWGLFYHVALNLDRLGHDCLFDPVSPFQFHSINSHEAIQ